MNDLIIIENNVPLADSRIVAEELGVQHSDFFQNIIIKYQEEVEEDFGILRFQNGVKSGPQRGLQPRYALLTEDQTNCYMSYSRNTEQARACKRKLVKAFSDAKKIIVQLIANQNQQTEEQIFTKDVQRRCMLNEKLLPPGYWCVVTEMWREAWTLEAFQKELKPSSLPDGSCGRKWKNHLKGINHPLLSKSKKACLHVPNQKNRIEVNIYPDGLLAEFRTWIRVEYADYYVTTYSPSRLKGVEQIEKPKKKGWLK